MLALRILAATVVFATVPESLAESYTVPLPGVMGAYGGPKTDNFDFGVSFVTIDEVRIGWTGTITPGLGHGDGVELPGDVWFPWPARFRAWLNYPPYAGSWWTFVGDNSFSTEQTFVPTSGATWDFLLDGEGDIYVELSPAIVIGGVMVTPPSGQILDAYLVVIPEPATLSLLAIGGLFGTRRRR